MRKSDFISKVRSMINPTIQEETSGSYFFINSFWYVWDKSNHLNDFCTPIVALTSKEYYSGNQQNYFRREENMRKKYIRWFEEATQVKR